MRKHTLNYYVIAHPSYLLHPTRSYLLTRGVGASTVEVVRVFGAGLGRAGDFAVLNQYSSIRDDGIASPVYKGAVLDEGLADGGFHDTDSMRRP